MSAVIHQFIVHQLLIDSNKALQLIPRPDCIDVTTSIETLAEQVNHAFNGKPGKGVGGFVDRDAEDDFSFSQAMQAYLNTDAVSDSVGAAFQHFTAQSGAHLVETLARMNMVETGFLVFCRYEFLATEYLMVTLLNTKQHVHVDNKLELSVSEHLDLAKMQLAARIDLTQFKIQPEHNRYISFIKGRMGRKVADFFMSFLGCEELADIKQQNSMLISTVDSYLSAEQLDPVEKQQHRQEVHDYYKDKIASGEDVKVSELSAKLPVSMDEQFDFSQFVVDSEINIDENFQPDRAVLKQLAKFSGQGGGISLSFDRHLYGDKVRYDQHTDTLVIRGVPPNLKDQLIRNDK